MKKTRRTKGKKYMKQVRPSTAQHIMPFRPNHMEKYVINFF